MPPYPILQTKLYIPPIRPELVSRPRLIERLNAGLSASSKLTLVSAPAGFGKTTLVSEWCQFTGVNVPPIYGHSGPPCESTNLHPALHLNNPKT